MKIESSVQSLHGKLILEQAIMTRRTKSLTVILGAIALALLAGSAASWAGDQPAAAEPQQQAEAEQRPLSPPPGISIIPSAPMRPQADGQVPGCPARNLKPLELLV